MEIEVGMYARIINTLEEYVEIIRIKENYEFKKFIIDENGRQYSTDEVLKASHNIIDLIEVGDYVNGYKVTAIYNPNGDDIFNFTLIMEHGYKTINPYIRHYPIKSIVTKEQFDSMKYVVGDKE